MTKLRIKWSSLLANRYNLLETLQSGEDATVYKGYDHNRNKFVAVKSIDKACGEYSVEAEAMSRLSGHPNIVSLVESFEAGSRGYIVMEFAKHGDLADMILSQGAQEEEAGRRLFRQLVGAVEHCHSRGLYHCDIKLENILRGEGDHDDSTLKLTDFGLAEITSPGEPSPMIRAARGTVLYSAPEVLEGKPFDGAMVDVWSSGVVLYGIVTGCLPFGGEVGEMLEDMYSRDIWLPEWMSGKLKSLILRMLDPHPQRRVTIDQVLSDDWLVMNQQADCGASSSKKRRRCSRDSSNKKRPRCGVRKAVAAQNTQAGSTLIC